MKGGGWGGRLFETGRLLTFSAFWMGAYSRFGAYSNKYGNYYPGQRLTAISVNHHRNKAPSVSNKI